VGRLGRVTARPTPSTPTPAEPPVRGAVEPARGGTERVSLHRAVAVIRPESIAVRPLRASLVVPLVQGLLAAGAVWLIAAFMDRLALWALGALLVFALIAGPTAVLGLVYNVAGTSFLMERRKQSARWQQGFLGLGLGTHELVPFWRIARFEVRSDAADRLSGGDVQDVVRWEVRLVKESGRALTVGTVLAARPLAAEGARRANRVAEALGAMAGTAVERATVPPEDEAGGGPADGDGRRRYRRLA